MKRGRILTILASPPAIASAAVVVLMLLAPGLSFVEVRAFDLLYRLIPPSGLDSHVAVVDIGDDPEVYEHLRRCHGDNECEIPRAAYAEATRRLSRWGAQTIVFDLMFSRHCDEEDEELVKAFDEAGNVVVAATTKVRPDAVSLKAPAIDPDVEHVWGVGSPVAHRPNETIRSVPLLVCDYDTGREYRALSLVAFQCFSGARPGEEQVTDGQWLATGGSRVPLIAGERIHLLPSGQSAEASPDSAVAAVEVVSGGNAARVAGLQTWNAVLVNWSGPKGTINSYSLQDVLLWNEEAGREAFGGKAVIIGRRSWDEHWTAVGAMPGPEIQANALHTLISGRFIRPMAPWAFLLLLFGFACTTSFAVRRIKVLRATFFIVLLMVVALAVSRELLARKGIWAYMFLWQASILLAWGITLSAQSNKVAAVLQRFVPAFMAGTGQRELEEVRTRDASVLFSDIRNYTTISEQLGAETVLRLLGPYRAALERIVRDHGGAIVITPGDAILAVFWQDHRKANHPTCAVRAGREILVKLPELGKPWEEAGVALQMGVGVNAGPVAMGFVGEQNLEATVIGDAVNVSQRLESLTKELGYPLILSESVQSRLKEDVGAIYLDEVTVRGRKLPIKVYGVVGPEGPGETSA
jgi:class 3 adenylate cyclase/CHASE2 domain-containing sensor protein